MLKELKSKGKENLINRTDAFVSICAIWKREGL